MPPATDAGMPTPQEILDQLTTTTRELGLLAIAWHIAILWIAVALLRGWRPTALQTKILFVTPPLSVAALAIAYGNPFNAMSFAALALVLAAARTEPWHLRDARWTRWIGAALIAFGMFYPHFVTGGWFRALYAAPVGLIPCPTLALISGFLVLGNGFRSRATPLVLSGWTTFYALFGIAKLGVVLDIGLLVAAASLATISLASGVRRASYPTA